ncbi:cytochrome P450 [Spirillospora sp. CA-253888]
MPRHHHVPRVPGALPLLGHIIPIFRDHLGFLGSAAAHGDIVEIGLGPFRTLLLTDPGLTRRFLLDDRTFDKGGVFFDRHRQASGNNLVVCPHADHRRQRRMLQPAFHRTRFPAYAETMTGQIASITGAWQDGAVIEVFDEMLQITSHTLIRAMFAVDMSEKALAEMVEDAVYLMDATVRHMALPPLLDRLPTRGNRRSTRARTRFRGHMGALLDDYRKDRVDHGDMLSILLGVDADGPGVTDTELCDQLQIFFMAGIETTATALAWALQLVAAHPEVERRLTAEADSVCAGRAATWDDLPELGYTERVITEALRLYPPGWFVTRTVSRDTELGGVPLKKGTTMAYSPYVVHRRKDLFTDPDAFDPDRWMDVSPAAAGQSGALLPFGAGPRKCIGDAFAMTEMVLTLATIAARWRLVPLTDRPVRSALGTTLHPRGLTMRITARTALPSSEPEAAPPTRPPR